MKFPRHLTLFTLLSVSAFTTLTARADLMGDFIIASSPLVPSSAVIGPDVEFGHVTVNSAFSGITWDFGADTLTVRNVFGMIYFGNGAGNFTFNGFDSVIMNVSSTSNTGFSGALLTPSFTDNSITLNMNDTVALGNASLVFQIDIQSSSVPDGGTTIAMISAAFAGFALLRRGSRRAGEKAL